MYRRECEYDKVGNRTKLTKTDGQTSVEYGYTYNGLGQLSTQYSPESSPTSRYVYSYDLNGNLIQKDEEVGGDPWVRQYRWTYEWDVQDRLIKVEKYDEVAMEYDACVEYKYCPSCGGALSERIEYESDGSTVKSWLRYQYHCLNLLRIDEKWDSDNDADIDANDLWRVLNLSVHGPGQIGQTVRSTACTYSNDDTEVQCQTRDYY